MRYFLEPLRRAVRRRMRSAGSLPTTRARIIRMPNPTLASPFSTRAKYARAIPACAANVRCDMPISSRAATRFRARARVNSLGAASASPADGVPGDRFAFTLQKITIKSRDYPSRPVRMARARGGLSLSPSEPAPRPVMEGHRGARLSFREPLLLSNPRWQRRARTQNRLHRRPIGSKYLLYIGLCSRLCVDNRGSRSKVCVIWPFRCSRLCAAGCSRSGDRFNGCSLLCVENTARPIAQPAHRRVGCREASPRDGQ
jgi:hypothetical protein